MLTGNIPANHISGTADQPIREQQKTCRPSRRGITVSAILQAANELSDLQTEIAERAKE